MFRPVLFAILVGLLSACIGTSHVESLDPRIDTFFRNSFAVLHREVNGLGVGGRNRTDYAAIAGDSVFVVAGISRALGFMQTITGISAPLRNPAQYTAAHTTTPEVVRRWEQWYLIHRRELRWDEQTKQPIRGKRTYR
ncbi:hypothetical protein [Hymenobacter persicinus]|uniref:Uncharacterized protein n=1 Tax=Hymenobacter persicinus TaxID=2025506 RepID=A0A4Q5L971_9BACT|nr:hypothetical protein [Hymenobacter persicinus]RYU78242.1 hypothetical protein EWM57_14870 [Hymenobacter persicinus]